MSAEYNLRIVLPRTKYYPGEAINFEVMVDNPHGILIEYLVIKLNQSILTSHSKKKSVFRSGKSQFRKSFDFKKHLITSKQSVSGFLSTSWMDSMKIPNAVLPTILASQNPLVLNRTEKMTDEIIEVRYHLEVWGIQTETFPLMSDEYPIEILSTEHGFANSGSRGELQHSQSVAGFSNRRRLYQRSPTHLELPSATHGFGSLSPGPPRYSALSLPDLSPTRPGRSASCETLPPNYEEITASLRQGFHSPEPGSGKKKPEVGLSPTHSIR